MYDPSGAVIPNATVLLTNLDAPSKETAVANAAGAYSLKSIPSGHYTLEVSTPGFKTFRRDVRLNPNDNQRLDIVMDVGAINERVRVTAAKPSVQQATPSEPPRRIKVGGMVTAAKLITKVAPIYPEIARQRGIEGPVLMHAIISTTGAVLSLKVINSADPDLAREAMNAVGQWRYEPTLLNGEPVEVVTTITMDFSLQPESSRPR
ncbi:MAG TPA: TonB family protein [Bryobacteraceae bacterium]|nr:TonB family protein [Bryobacteraceae bacterium]